MPSAAAKANILLVDDLPEKLLTYETILEELGENLISARSGAEALRHVLKADFAVILLDVQMPGMDGFETAQLIRRRKQSAHTPIIFLTAYADELQTAQGYATGGVDYLATPAAPEILRAKVRVFVELFRMRQQVAQQVEDRAERAAAEESARRSSFLSEASRALASSLDFEATLSTLAHLAVPQLADYSLVSLADQHGGIERTVAAWTWSDPSTGAASPPLGHECRLQAWLADIVTRALTSNKMQLHLSLKVPAPAACPDGTSNGDSNSQGALVDSVVVLPLMARTKMLGALTIARMPSSRRYSHGELALAKELSERAAIALDNVLLVRDIQQADRHRNEFLAMLAHELRNPLAPLRNAAEVLRLQGSNRPEFTWAQDVITRQVTHMVRLVDDLLDVSRITRGKIRLELKQENAADIVASAVETARPLIVARKHVLTTTLPEDLLWVNVDATRLAQVLSNLLTNAAKYTPDGGRLSLVVQREGDQAVFRVRDSGEGIPREMLSHIFDLFTQVDQSLARSQGGLGIGLTLVRRLVEMHGGSVQASSEGPGQGSEFVVRLPAQALPRPEAVPTGTKPAATTSWGGPCRILVVDDNVDAADSLAAILQLNGHTVQMAHDGLAALDRVRAHKPDAVLLDIGLPGLSGLEVAQRLRAQEENKGLTLIAVSGYAQEEDFNRSRRAGFDHHFVKPVDIGLLLRSLPCPAAREGAECR